MFINFFKKKYNLILIVIDMFRPDCLNRFPVFEELRKESIFFPNMVTYAPYTIASMHAVFSGAYGFNTKVNGYYNSNKFDYENYLSLPQYFKNSSYITIGNANNKLLVPQKGFDELSVHDEHKDNLIQMHSDLIKQCASSKKNFFLYLHFSSIHKRIVKNVINAYDDFDENYYNNKDANFQRYLGFAALAQEYLSEIYNLYKKIHLNDNTLLAVITDHGCGIGEKPGELAYGIYVYDYTIKTWAFLILPGELQEKKNISIPYQTRTVDLMPTVLEYCNIKVNKKFNPFDGKSLIPFINGVEKKHRTAFSETGGIDGPHPSPFEPNVKCLRTNDRKLIYNLTTKKKELYDLIKDPDELNNVAGKGFSIEEELWRDLIKY